MSAIPGKKIKCLVWDLDQTLWSGILLEGDPVALRPGVRETIVELDKRGILQSIASQNDPDLALEQLRAWGLVKYFLHPQFDLIADKASQIANVRHLLNLQLEHMAFIDDDPGQRAYVAYALPAVTVLEASQAPTLTHMDMFAVEHPTEETRHRREFYQAEIQRQAAERDWRGQRLDFLRSCHIVLALRPAAPQDVPRIGELVERTNQLNTAAHHLSTQDIARQLNSSDYCLMVAHMSNRFGDYGTVGVLIVHQLPQKWVIEVLLVSCRVMGQGIGEGLLCYGLRQAKEQGQQSLHALYRKTAYNRAMHLLFVTHGFKRWQEQNGLMTFTHDLRVVPDYPTWLDVQIT
jgi:FkbH-like protein